jgi:hypothetical protein
MARGFEKPRQGPHARAANPDQMRLHNRGTLRSERDSVKRFRALWEIPQLIASADILGSAQVLARLPASASSDSLLSAFR